MPMVLLALLPLAFLAPAALSSSCAWRSCRHVILESGPAGNGEASLPTAALSVHRCELDHHSQAGGAASRGLNDGCQLPAADEGRVVSFSMTRAGLRSTPLRDLCRFANLTAIDLSENAIAEFVYPVPLNCHIRLLSLSLRGNRLTQLDLTQMLYLESLEVVDVSENPMLESIFVTHLPDPRRCRLKSLNAARCRVKHVDVSLVRLASLQDVNLSYNQVTLLTNRLRWHWTLDDIRAVEREREHRRSIDASYYLRLTVRLTHNQLGSEAFGARRLWGLPVPPLDGAPDAVVSRLKLYRDAFQPFLHVDNRGSTVTCDCRALHAWRYFKNATTTAAPTASGSASVEPSVGLFARRNALAIEAWLGLPCESRSVRRTGQPATTLLSVKGDELQCDHQIDCPAGCICTERVGNSLLTVNCTGASRLTALPRRLPAGVHRVRYRLLLGGNRIHDLPDSETPSRADRVDELDLSGNRLSRAARLTGLRRFASLRLINLTGSGLFELPDALLDAGADRGVRVVLGSAQLACNCDLFQPSRWRRVLAALPPTTYRQLRCQDDLPLLDFQHLNCPPAAASASAASAASAPTADNATNSNVIFRDRRPRDGSDEADDGPVGSAGNGAGSGRGDLVGASVLLIVGVASGAVVVALAVATVAVAVANSRRFADFFFLRGEGGSGGVRQRGRSGGRRGRPACSANSPAGALTAAASATSTSCGSAVSAATGAPTAAYFARKSSPLLLPPVGASGERQPLFPNVRCCGIPPDLVPPSLIGFGASGQHSSPYDLPRYVCSTDFTAEDPFDDERQRCDRLALRGQLILRNSSCNAIAGHPTAATLPLPERRRLQRHVDRQERRPPKQRQQLSDQLRQQHRSSSGSDLDFGGSASRLQLASSSSPAPPLPPPRGQPAPLPPAMSASTSVTKLLEAIAFPVGMETDV